MNVSALLIALLFLSLGLVEVQAQSNYEHLTKQVEEGKTYAVRKAKEGETNAIREDKSYYIRLVPAVYQTILDTIELSPALNGNLDTSNYFVQTEVLVLKEAGTEWKMAQIATECTTNTPEAAICLLKTTPKYEIVNKKFFPFKNITDTSNTDNIIPGEYVVTKREELLEDAKLEVIYDKTKINPKDKTIYISQGVWRPWEEVVCPMGIFNTPSIKEIQEALLNKGYNIKISNSYDEQTKRALHEFQQDHVLEVGELDDKTIERLGIKRHKLIQIID